MTGSRKLAQLAPFTREGKLAAGCGDHYIFFVGRDDVHGILRHLIQQEKTQFKFNMYAFTDRDVNADIIALINAGVAVQGTLDASEVDLRHGISSEIAMLVEDEKLGPVFYEHFVAGQTPTGQISHTKGGVLVGQGIAFEGSTNWSHSGEGIGIVLNGPQKRGFIAQNNTLVVSTNPVFVKRFSEELDAEHAQGKPFPPLTSLPQQLALPTDPSGDDERE